MASPRTSLEASHTRIRSDSRTLKTRRSHDLQSPSITVPQSPRSPKSKGSPPSQSDGQQRFVLSDPIAFGYLADDPCTTVLSRSQQLQGYQIYVVEQWACSRTHPTFVVTAFTGDSAHTIQVGVLSVPADEESWSDRLRVYFKTLAQYYARRRDTPLGVMMVTNLSTFPSSLTIVLVPDGDLRKHREDFFVSEDLKRLGCSGRVGLSITPPTQPAQAKFHQLYRVSDRIDFYSAVIELVKLCQVALVIFGCLDAEYADGLLCDVTERAVNEWWLRIGSDMYGVEVDDSILGHTTVSALLGTLIGARNRLNAYGAPVAKDVFDVEATTKAISYFQKSQRIHRSRRLDRVTLDRLHKTTAKQASGDGWTVPKAVKSTVAELSGKGGEMVMEMVGKANKASIAEIETVDIERFAQLARGERARWLWHGKSRKKKTLELFTEKSMKKTGIIRPHDDTPKHDDAEDTATDEDLPPESQRHPTELPDRVNSGARSSVVEDPSNASMNEQKQTTYERAKDRLKGAVGMGHRSTKSGDFPSDVHTRDQSVETLSAYQQQQQEADRKDTEDIGPGDELGGELERGPSFARHLTETPTASQSHFEPPDRQPELGAPFDYDDGARMKPSASMARGADEVDSEFRDIEEHLPEDERPVQVSALLRRTQSLDAINPAHSRPANPDTLPRQLSYSIAEDTVHSTAPTSDASSDTDEDANTNPKTALTLLLQNATQTRNLQTSLLYLHTTTAPFVLTNITTLESLSSDLTTHLTTLNEIHEPHASSHATLVDSSREIIAEEKAHLQEEVKELETVQAKLEYEVSALRDKVEDVEVAVREFERRVGFCEGRVGELVGRRSRRGSVGGMKGTKEQGWGWEGWARGLFRGPVRDRGGVGGGNVAS